MMSYDVWSFFFNLYDKPSIFDTLYMFLTVKVRLFIEIKLIFFRFSKNANLYKKYEHFLNCFLFR